jgi:K+-sensing histidine kinase KdpD
MRGLGTRPLLRAAFAAIAILFAVVAGGMIWRVSSVRNQTRSLVRGMLASVELVSRLGRDVGRQRRLVDSHIFSKRGLAMGRLETEIATTRADYAQAAQSYAAISQPPDEAALWQRLQKEVDTLTGPVDDALALSREDRDDEAQQAMQALMPRYLAIDELVGQLIAANRADAERTMHEVERLQERSLWTLAGLALLGVILSVWVGVGVTRSVQATEEQLQKQSQLLEARNRELDAFAGRVAHDLRGPLTTLKLAVDNLTNGVSVERAEKLLGRGVERMTALIEDLLAFSRAEAAAETACDPAATAAQLCEEMTPRLEQVGAQLTVAVEPAQVRCSGSLLRQVLWNLVDNAVKYHRDGVRPEVEIRGHTAPGGYDLVVRDNGMGMSADEVSHAFEPLYRGRQVQGIAGTGLGLSLVKRVLEASGGDVAIQSEPGHGTAFVIHMPRA